MLDRTLRLAPLAAILLFLTGCLSAVTVAQDRTTSGTVALDADGTVTVDNHEGAITIDTWDRNEVRYEAVVRPERGADHPEATIVEVDRSDDRFTLRTEYDDSKGDGGGLFGWGGSQNIMPVHYTLTVPGTARIEIDDHESEIEIRNGQADLSIDTHEGPITVEMHAGDVEIDTHESDVTMRSITGDLEIDRHEGRLEVDGLNGGLELDTHEGDARIAFATLTRDVSIDSHEGTFALTVPSGAGFDLSTDFDDDADLDADFDLAPYRVGDDEDDEVNYSGRVHGGGPRLRLGSHDGRFEIRTR
jgi:hypothetical protein